MLWKAWLPEAPPGWALGLSQVWPPLGADDVFLCSGGSHQYLYLCRHTTLLLPRSQLVQKSVLWNISFLLPRISWTIMVPRIYLFFKNWDSIRISLKSPQSEVITPYTKLMCIYSNKSQLIVIFSSPVWFLFHSFKMSLTSLLGMFLTALSPGYLLSWVAKCDVKSCPSSIFNGTYRILRKLLNYLNCLGLNSLMCKWR